MSPYRVNHKIGLKVVAFLIGKPPHFFHYPREYIDSFKQAILRTTHFNNVIKRICLMGAPLKYCPFFSAWLHFQPRPARTKNTL